MRKKILIGLIIGLVISLIPFKTVLVPEWRIHVVDENGNPYPGKLVRESCDDYTLGISPCKSQGNAMQITDEQGFVVFPERSIISPLMIRVGRSMLNIALVLAHGSIGKSLYVDSSGPQGYKELKYIPGEPLQDTLVLPSKAYETPK